VCAFAVVYARVERRWPLALGAASATYALLAVVLSRVDAPVPLLAAVALGCVVLALRLVRRRTVSVASGSPPAWDLPARVVVATGLVVGITVAAPALGPFTSAALATFPIFATILGVFAHRAAGHVAASEVMRGLVHGIAGFTAFFLVVAVALVPLGIVVTYTLATVTVLLVQAVMLAIVRRETR